MVYERDIIQKLLEKYERSKSFNATNKVKQTFKIDVKKMFPMYGDVNHYDQYQQINDAILTLEVNKMITYLKTSGGRFKQICLNLDNLDNCYEYIGRKKKATVNATLIELFENYLHKNKVLDNYCKEQMERIKQNKNVKRFNANLDELNDILKAVENILQVDDETYMRDFSMKVFKNSKTFEVLLPKIISILWEYGDYSEKEMILHELNILKTPSSVAFKGTGRLCFHNCVVDLNEISGDVSLSSETLKDLKKIEVTGERVVTIENKTSFYTAQDSSAFIVYLGGFHSSAKRKLIKLIAENNSDIEYYHFGDIDSGGLYILNHLIDKTGIPFKPLLMNVATLKKYKDFWRQLSQNDKKRLHKLKAGRFSQLVEYMLNNNCKLEQEAVLFEVDIKNIDAPY